MSLKGRPTDNPKKGRIEVRISQEEEKMFEFCCELTGKSKAEIVRMGIKMVYDELKNN